MTEETKNDIRNCLGRQTEWLLIHAGGKTFALQSAEIEINFERDKILFGFPGDLGFQTWRVVDCKIEGGELTLDLSRNFGKERERIKLVPRISVRELSNAVELARLEKANKLGMVIEENVPDAKLVRVELSGENGRLAQIIFEQSRHGQIAVLADVSGTLTTEILLSTAILRLVRLQGRKQKPIRTLWIAGEKKQAKNLQKLRALLRPNWQEKIKIFQLSPAADAARENLEELPAVPLAQLWRAKPKAVNPPESRQMSETARRIVELAPDEIDLLFNKNGETLRFFGLPFARVRKIFEREKAWFGVEKTRQILPADNWKDLLELIENLKTYRRFASPNQRHAFYSLAPEAWLEASFRRNIKLLDANLMLSPLYQQFSAERGRIDLLALRRDGRLVIIELKVAPDREVIFQAANYWRKIERQRRKGNLQKAKLFGETAISDKPALVYLVAPTLSFHQDYKFLAGTIAPEIEIYRFDLNENWREKIRVSRRL